MQYQIKQPTLLVDNNPTQMAQELFAVRRNVFVDEYSSAGVPEENAKRYIERLKLEEFTENLQDHIDRGNFLRAAIVGGKAVGFCAGLIERIPVEKKFLSLTKWKVELEVKVLAVN